MGACGVEFWPLPLLESSQTKTGNARRSGKLAGPTACLMIHIGPMQKLLKAMEGRYGERLMTSLCLQNGSGPKGLENIQKFTVGKVRLVPISESKAMHLF